MVAGELAVIDVNGNDRGVAEIIASIDSADPDVMRIEFQRVVTGIALLKVAPGLRGALATWSGQQQVTTVGNARVVGQCDATQCDVDVTSVEGPLEPLRLP
jgi:hypothetical protein